MLFIAALEVLHLIVTAEHQQEALREQYACHELQVNDNGKRTSDYDVIRVDGKPYRKLVARNGQPLSEQEARMVEEDMRAHRRRSYNMHIGKFADLETTHNLTLAGNILTATPKAKGPYRHRFQFDPATHVIVRHQVDVVGPGSELKPGTVLVREFTREPGDGLWLLRTMNINYKAARDKGNQFHTFTNYRKFDASSTITFEEPTPK